MSGQNNLDWLKERKFFQNIHEVISILGMLGQPQQQIQNTPLYGLSIDLYLKDVLQKLFFQEA